METSKTAPEDQQTSACAAEAENTNYKLQGLLRDAHEKAILAEYEENALLLLIVPDGSSKAVIIRSAPLVALETILPRTRVVLVRPSAKAQFPPVVDPRIEELKKFANNGPEHVRPEAVYDKETVRALVQRLFWATGGSGNLNWAHEYRNTAKKLLEEHTERLPELLRQLDEEDNKLPAQQTYLPRFPGCVISDPVPLIPQLAYHRQLGTPISASDAAELTRDYLERTAVADRYMTAAISRVTDGEELGQVVIAAPSSWPVGKNEQPTNPS